MGRIERFEDIVAWQKARVLNLKIYRVTGQVDFAKDFTLRDQIRRASISIMLNIAEGFARHTPKEFARFLYIAHGSTAEVQSALYIALYLDYISDNEFKELYKITEEVSKIIAGFIRHLGQRNA